MGKFNNSVISICWGVNICKSNDCASVFRLTKQLNIIALLLLFFLVSAGKLQAHSVGDKFTFGVLKYEITSLNPKEAKVISNYTKPAGDITIPYKVQHNGDSYNVTTIGDMVFYNCTNISYIYSHIEDPEGVDGKNYLFGGVEGGVVLDYNISELNVPAEKTAHCRGYSEWNKSANIQETTINVTGVSLKPYYAAIRVGESHTFVATIEPTNATNKKVTWSSSNTEVATVDANGNVMGLSSGNATIKVTTEDGKHTATSAVYVYVPVTGLTLQPEERTIVVGDNFTLVPIITPSNATDKNVSWTSSNTAVATVDDDGIVTGVSVGNAVITATSSENSSITATCNVTVSATAISVTGVTLDITNKQLNKGETFTLTPTIAPANATNYNVTWTSSNDAVATVDANGKVTAVAVGDATITVTTEDGNHTATCSVTVTTPTAIENIDNTLEFNVYPTVVEDGFTVEFEGKFNRYFILEIYSLSGTKVHTEKINNYKQYVDVSNLKIGVYILRLGDKTCKIVKK